MARGCAGRRVGDDVPVVHGDTRRRALAAWPRERAAIGAERTVSGRGFALGSHETSVRPVLDVQGVQIGVPVERRCREAENRVSRPSAQAAGGTIGRAAAGKRGVVEPVGGVDGPAVEPAAVPACRAGGRVRGDGGRFATDVAAIRATAFCTLVRYPHARCRRRERGAAGTPR